MNLYSLTADCTVRIQAGGGRGTGFFVGRGLIITCAHVVTSAEQKDDLQITWPAQGIACRVEKVLRCPEVSPENVRGQYPYPDIALLTVSLRDNPSVLIGIDQPDPGDQVYAYGYTDEYGRGDSSHFVVEGPSGGPEVLLKLKGAQVRRGMSGAPILDLHRGEICGLLKASRGVDTDLGGRAVPSKVLLEYIPHLQAAQQDVRFGTKSWRLLRSATTLNSLPQLGAKWSLFDDVRDDNRLVLPSLDIVRLAAKPLISCEGPADSGYIEAVRNLVGPIVELDNLFGGQDLARIASRIFRAIYDRIVVGDYDPAVETDLLAASAEIAEVAGWLAYDADDQRMARQLNHEALMLSQMSGDRALELLVLQNMSMQASYLNRPREALLLARRVASDGRPLSARLMAIFKVREGRALAQEGRAADARKAFVQARALFSDGAADRDPAWSWWFEHHELAWHEAMAEADLGNWQTAIDLFRSSINPSATTSHRDKYVYRSNLLWALAKGGDWRAADEVIDELSGFVGNVASQRTISLLKRVEKLLNQERDAPARRRAADHLGDLLSY